MVTMGATVGATMMVVGDSGDGDSDSTAAYVSKCTACNGHATASVTGTAFVYGGRRCRRQWRRHNAHGGDVACNNVHAAYGSVRRRWCTASVRRCCMSPMSSTRWCDCRRCGVGRAGGRAAAVSGRCGDGVGGQRRCRCTVYDGKCARVSDGMCNTSASAMRRTTAARRANGWCQRRQQMRTACDGGVSARRRHGVRRRRRRWCGVMYGRRRCDDSTAVSNTACVRQCGAYGASAAAARMLVRRRCRCCM